MKKWEYKVVETDGADVYWIQRETNKLSPEGWEIISVFPKIYNGNTIKAIITAKRLIHQKKNTSTPKPAKIW